MSVEQVLLFEPRIERIKSEEIVTDESVGDSQKAELVKILNKYREYIAKKPS